MEKHKFDQFPVKNADGCIMGMLTTTILTNKLVKRKLTVNDPIENIVLKEFRNVSLGTTLAELGRIFQRHQFVFVDQKFIASSQDLLNFIC